MLDRRQLLDVGAAGPLAGFALTLVVLVWGFATSEAIAPGLAPHGVIMLAGERVGLGDSLLVAAFRQLFLPGAQSAHLSLPAFAGWVGAFTGLNRFR